MENRDWLVEYAVGSVANRTHFCTLKEFGSVISKNLGKEIYRSMFLYDKDIIDHVKKTHSVSNYKGVQGVDKLVLDIDLQGEGKGEEARQNACEARMILIDTLGLDESYVSVWFSGRGFHIHIPNIYNFQPSKNVAKQVRATMQRDFGNYIDNIYDGRRLIRASYSFNKKTNCYKIPLNQDNDGQDELADLTYNDIKEMAIENRLGVNDYKPKKIEYKQNLDLKPVDISRKNSKEHREIYKDAKAETSRYITCVQHIYNSGEVQGHRHKNLLRLASIYIRHYGMQQRAVDAVARQYMAQFKNPLPNDEVSRIIADAYKAGGYKYKCSDDVLSQYCDPKCVLYRYKSLDESSEVLSAEDMSEKLIEYMNTDFTDKSFDLKTVFPFMPQSYVFKAGQMAVLLGDTKLGKTAFWQYVITMIPQVKTLFMSLEVDDITMIRRFLQIGLQQNKDTIGQSWKTADPSTIKEGIEKISHIKLLTTSPDLSAYPELIQEHKPKIVVIDTIDMVPARYAKNDELQKQGYITAELKKIAMDQDVIILAVSHISKGASYRIADGQALDIHSGKGNSALEQKADKIIAFEGDRDNSKRRVIRSVGSRDESGFHIVCNYDWDTFTFSKRS